MENMDNNNELEYTPDDQPTEQTARRSSFSRWVPLVVITLLLSAIVVAAVFSGPRASEGVGTTVQPPVSGEQACPYDSGGKTADDCDHSSAKAGQKGSDDCCPDH